MLLVLLICLFIFLYLFAVFPRISQQDRVMQYKGRLFAHRGYHCASLGVPENSMPAFAAAVQRGYGIELDIHLTKDGRLVVFHDDDLWRMCAYNGRIEDLTYHELEQFCLLDTKERIPLFTEVLSYVNGQVPLLIELKIPGHAAGICSAACEVLKSYPGPYMIQSFNTLGIRWFKLHAPEILRGQLSSNLTKKEAKQPRIVRFAVKYLLADCLGRPDFISYKLSDLPVANVTFLHRVLKTPVAVWTLRTESALKEGIQAYDMQIFERQKENY